MKQDEILLEELDIEFDKISQVLYHLTSIKKLNPTLIPNIDEYIKQINKRKNEIKKLRKAECHRLWDETLDKKE